MPWNLQLRSGKMLDSLLINVPLGIDTYILQHVLMSCISDIYFDYSLLPQLHMDCTEKDINEYSRYMLHQLLPFLKRLDDEQRAES